MKSSDPVNICIPASIVRVLIEAGLKTEVGIAALFGFREAIAELKNVAPDERLQVVIDAENNVLLTSAP